MKKLRMMWICASLLIGSSGFIPGNVVANEPGRNEPASIASGMGGVIEGKVIEVESQTLVVEKNNGKIVRVHMPGKSGDTSSEFKKGDYVEAALTPEGTTTSVRVVVNPEKHDINPNIR